MLSALICIVCAPWILFVSYLSRPWSQLLCFDDTARTKTSETGVPETNTSEVNQPEAATVGPDTKGFPDATDEQSKQARRTFIESLDPDAICALASRYNNNKPCCVVRKACGSFNVCFFIEFGRGEPQWVLRIPIEPALDNPWDKMLSEVATIQYIARETRIPVPNIHAFGRDAVLTKNGVGTQMFLMADLIPGEALNKKLLIQASRHKRRAFYSQLIDILSELRKLEFRSIGSLMPNPDGTQHPVLGPVISMSAATLRLPSKPIPVFDSAKDYIIYQFSLIAGFFLPPVPDHTIDDIKQEVFALHEMERIFHQVIDPQLDKGPFVLHHLDLRSPNIIVDTDLHIQGIIDWEFASTIPRQLFTPPSWITGHDSIETNEQMHAEFCDALDEKSKTDSFCHRMRRERYGELDGDKSDIDRTDMAFCVAHVLRRPTDVTDIFCDFFAPKLCGRPLDYAISDFFNNHQALAVEAQRRAEHCERYTAYLRENGLYETRADKLLAVSKALKAKWGWS